ncbi:MAG: DoxX family protein [Candidatus Solibacter sp.]
MTKEGREYGWLFLRLGIAGMVFGLHGWARLGKLYSHFILGQPWSFVALVERIGFPLPVVFAVASALVESVGAILLLAGYRTRWVAALMAFNMVVATGFELSKGAAGGPELPGMYLIPLLALAMGGAGRYSLDSKRRAA